MDERKLSSRTLVAYAGSDAFVDKTQVILARLGYKIIAADDYESARQALGGSASAELLLVDDRRQDDVPRSGELSDVPMVLLTGRGEVSAQAERVLGTVKRPAGLHDLYRLVQQLFEDSPRTTPRVPINLPARCDRKGERWHGSLISISENGGLLQGVDSLSLGSRFDLSFDLPGAGPLALTAEAAYQLVPNVGIVFSGIAPAARDAIGEFVKETILS